MGVVLGIIWEGHRGWAVLHVVFFFYLGSHVYIVSLLLSIPTF
jgi:hypothetical protein